MSDHVVEIRNLTRRFGKTTALDGVSLDVKPGQVYGLVGANGQGKTTLIRHLLGLLKAEEGTVRVFGMDPVRDAVQVLERVGYLSEHRELPDWMRIDEMMRYTSAFYPKWDQDYASELIRTFRLDGSKKVKDLSKGMRAQVGLIAAVAHQPDLLLLDEPSTGLDAVVRKDILNEVIRAVADAGRTAIFSSHLLDEVEQMSDHVLMIDGGRMVLQGTLDDLKQQHEVLSVQFEKPREDVANVNGILFAEQLGTTWTIICNGAIESVRTWVKDSGGEITSARNASLQEIFVARVGRDRVPAESL